MERERCHHEIACGLFDIGKHNCDGCPRYKKLDVANPPVLRKKNNRVSIEDGI